MAQLNKTQAISNMPTKKKPELIPEFYRNILEKLGLTLIYGYAILFITYFYLKESFIAGQIPLIIRPIASLVLKIITHPVAITIAKNQADLLFVYLLMRLTVIYNPDEKWLLLAYNLVLVALLLMTQALINNITQRLLSPIVLIIDNRWNFRLKPIAFLGDPIFLHKISTAQYTMRLIIYLSLYVQAMRKKYGTFPGIELIVHSAAVWLRIDTLPEEPKPKKK